jgi:hypothetical protein
MPLALSALKVFIGMLRVSSFPFPSIVLLLLYWADVDIKKQEVIRLSKMVRMIMFLV